MRSSWMRVAVAQILDGVDGPRLILSSIEWWVVAAQQQDVVGVVAPLDR